MADQTLTFTLDTGDGEDRNVVIKLRDDLAPNHVKQITDLAKEGFYDGVVFHRVIPGFMVQGGGFTAQMQQKSTKDPIRNEASNGLHNTRGTLSMARTSNPNSATSQFFINVADNAFLDPGRDAGYAVFAKVVKGMDVVDQIVNSPTTRKNGMADVPADPVLIKSAKRID